MSKSYVETGYELCPVCTKKHHESLLLDKKLKSKIEQENFLSWNLCDEHKAQRKDKFDFLIAIDEAQSEQPYQLNNIYRTGSIIAIKTDRYNQIFDKSPPTNGITFCDEKTILKLQSMILKE